MARLPQPGGDRGSWGDLLNDFLSVTHNSDGTLKTGSISEDKLDTAAQAKLNTAGGGAVDSVAGKTGVVTLVPGDVGLGNVDNTSDNGKPISAATQAALDLKANASAVATALGNKIETSEKGVANGVATLGESGLILPTQLASGTGTGSTYLRGDGVWGTPGGTGGGGTVAWDDVTDKPVVIAYGATQAAARTAIGAGTSNVGLAGSGSATTASKSDHTHAATDIASGTIATARLGSGTASATTYLRGDGTWSTVSGSGTVTAANITDATTIGRSVLTTASASAARTTLGLGNVNDTSDANKPVSSATQIALDAKQATLVSGTNIKTVNGQTILGSGNIPISGGGGGSVTVLGASDTIPNGTPAGLIVRLPEES